MVLQSLELGLGEGIVIRHLGPAERACYPEVGEQLRRALAGHRRAAVRVQGQHLRRDALLVAGLGDQAPGQRRALPHGDHPSDDVTAEDIEQDVEVEVRPLLRPSSLVTSHDPT